MKGAHKTEDFPFLDASVAKTSSHTYDFDLCFVNSTKSRDDQALNPSQSDNFAKLAPSQEESPEKRGMSLEEDLLDSFTCLNRAESKPTLESIRSTFNLHTVEKPDLMANFVSSLTPAEILGVSKDASYEEIRSVYKEKLRKMHPDKNLFITEAEKDLFNRLTEAYQILTKE